jgi:hypothetical protein
MPISAGITASFLTGAIDKQGPISYNVFCCLPVFQSPAQGVMRNENTLFFDSIFSFHFHLFDQPG